MPTPDVLGRPGHTWRAPRASIQTPSRTAAPAHEALIEQAQSILRRGCYALLPLLVLLIGAVVYRSALVRAFEIQPHPTLSAYLVSLMVLVCLAMVAMLGTLQNDSRGWCQDWVRLQHQRAATGTDMGAPRGLIMRHLLERRSPDRSTLQRLATVRNVVARLDARHATRLEAAELLAGLTLGLGLLTTLAGVLTSMGESPAGGTEGPSAALAAALFTLLVAVVHGALLAGMRQTARECRRMVQTSAWTLLGQDSPTPDTAHPPAAPDARSLLAGTTQTPATIQTPEADTTTVLRAQLHGQHIRERQLIERLEAQLGAHWTKGHKGSAHPPPTQEAPPVQPLNGTDAQQRLNRLQHLLHELQSSNQRLLQRIGPQP